MKNLLYLFNEHLLIKNLFTKNLFALLVLIVFLLPHYACNTTEPIININSDQDTTSHNFTFETITFGEYNSAFYDVAVIDENNIWAVGAVYLNDSLGIPDPNAYNAVHWDGNKWELKRIFYYGNCSAVKYPPLKAIWVFSTSDIVVSNGGSIGWFDGNKITLDCGVNQLLLGVINKIWGSNNKDLYLVGNNGAIVHYNGSEWTKIESGTDLHFYDIYGQQSTSGEYEVFCVAAKQLVNTDKKILRITDNSVTDINVSGIKSSLSGIWFKPGEKYYVVGSGMFSKADINSSQSWESFWEGITQYYTASIDGNDLNDIVVCGAYGELLHYNGNSWKSYQSELQSEVGSYGRIKIKDNLIVAVGSNSAKAIITIGRR